MRCKCHDYIKEPVLYPSPNHAFRSEHSRMGIGTRESAIAIGIIFPIIGASLIALRFYIRWHQKSYIGIDDWLCLPAWVSGNNSIQAGSDYWVIFSYSWLAVALPFWQVDYLGFGLWICLIFVTMPNARLRHLQKRVRQATIGISRFRSRAAAYPCSSTCSSACSLFSSKRY